MLLLLLRKYRNSLGICYRAGLKAQVSFTTLTEKHKRKTKITQILNKVTQKKEHKCNCIKQITIKLSAGTISTLLISSLVSYTE
jgi:hypothetical protein